MAKRNDLSAHCVIRDSSSAEVHGIAEDCRILESVQKLMSLGLSAREIRLGLAEGTVEALCEYARLDGFSEGDQPGEVVGQALGTLLDETRRVDLELEMLGLRKRALSKRAKLLHKLADMLREPTDT